jgi:hypothetical protein
VEPALFRPALPTDPTLVLEGGPSPWGDCITGDRTRAKQEAPMAVAFSVAKDVSLDAADWVCGLLRINRDT